jgi:hypothetical protein
MPALLLIVHTMYVCIHGYACMYEWLGDHDIAENLRSTSTKLNRTYIHDVHVYGWVERWD